MTIIQPATRALLLLALVYTAACGDAPADDQAIDQTNASKAELIAPDRAGCTMGAYEFEARTALIGALKDKAEAHKRKLFGQYPTEHLEEGRWSLVPGAPEAGAALPSWMLYARGLYRLEGAGRPEVEFVLRTAPVGTLGGSKLRGFFVRIDFVYPSPRDGAYAAMIPTARQALRRYGVAGLNDYSQCTPNRWTKLTKSVFVSFVDTPRGLDQLDYSETISYTGAANACGEARSNWSGKVTGDCRSELGDGASITLHYYCSQSLDPSISIVRPW